MKVSAIILAAGEGRRMGARTPKALLPLGGRPLVMHSIAAFASVREVAEIVLVLPAGRVDRVWKRLGTEMARLGVTKVVAGGGRRQDSVLRGLKMTSRKADVVLVHDSARPFASADLIRRVARAAWRGGAALAAVPARDTIKRVGAGGRVLATLDRRELWSAQTPQGFRRGVLMKAYEAGHGRADATDDAQVVERGGDPVAVVEGEAANLKITSKEDLIVAENVLRRLRRARI